MKPPGNNPKPGIRLFIISGIVAGSIFFSLFLLMNGCRDSCQDITCLNGGACIDGSCNCPDGYSGADCGSNVSASYLGTYNVSEVCPNITSYTVNIFSDTLDFRNVKIANFFNSFANLVTATVNQTSITIPVQAPDGDGRVVTGSGTFMAPNQITWNYSVTDASGTIGCSNSVWKK